MRRHSGEDCKTCAGNGWRWYSNTSTWRRGMGGCAMTRDLCDSCWGSGDANQSWTNLQDWRDNDDQRIHEQALKLLAEAAGATFIVCQPAATEIVKELRKLARGRKARPQWFQNMCDALANRIEQAIGERGTKT
jgi:hypothetical protein